MKCVKISRRKELFRKLFRIKIIPEIRFDILCPNCVHTTMRFGRKKVQSFFFVFLDDYEVGGNEVNGATTVPHVKGSISS